jgi:hypothetical protein
MTDGEERIPLDEAGEVSLPIVDVLTGRGFITGKSGSGKSNTASVLAEELLDRGFPLLVVDTDGEYWGLKETYELLHVGADEECDLQVGPEHAGKIAELALEQNVPIILDVSGYLDADEANDLIRETASELFTREKKLNKPFLMLVEEIHEYIPEGGGLDDTGEMLIRVAKRGRKRGLGLTGMSQRPANVKKDYITQCDWLMWHRLTWENDTDVVRRVVGKGYDETVQDLEDGEALLMADFLDADVERVQVRRKRTFDAGATPDLGEFERPELKSIDADLVGELKEISQREEQRRDRVAELERELEAKRERIGVLEEELENARDMTNMAEQFTEAMLQSGGGSDGASEKMSELVEERNRLESEVADREEHIGALEARVEDLQDAERRLEQYQDLNVDEAAEAVVRLQEALGVEVDGEAGTLRRKLESARERIEELEQEQSAPEPDVLEHPSVRRYINRMREEVGDLEEKERQMLEWYKYNGPGPVEDAYWAAGGSRKSSAKREKNRTLLNKDLIEKESRGEYRYALPDLVREWFADNDHVGDDEVEAILLKIEDAIASPDENSDL